MYKIIVCCVIISVGVKSKVLRNGLEMRDLIGFPENEDSNNLQNQSESGRRPPLYLPAICSENELYYPGGQKNEWICDCRDSYLYHPATSLCWAAWQRGPCGYGEYLVLPKNSFLPECQTNPCEHDGLVQYQGNCESLGSEIPCKHKKPSVATLGVNGTTLEIDCLVIRYLGESPKNNSSTRSCLPGSKIVGKECFDGKKI